MKKGLRKTALLTAFAMLTLVFSTITAWAYPYPAIMVSGTNIYANGNAIVIAQGTSADYTLIYLDSNNDGVIDDIASPVAFTGLTGDITGGYDLSTYTIFGGSVSDPVTSTKIIMTSGKVGYVYGGGYDGNVTGDTSITISGGRIVYNVYGGGLSGDVDGSTFIDMSGGTLNCIYGGGLFGNCGSTSVSVSGGKVNYSVYGGGYDTTAVTGSTSVTVSNTAEILYHVYGGGYDGDVTGDTSVAISGGTVGTVYGGGVSGTSVSTSVSVSGGKVNYSVYGGGYNTTAVTGSTSVEISGGAVNYSVYGGGVIGDVTGSTSVTVSGGTISQDVFGGGHDTTSKTANTSIKISSGAVKYSVYGGGFYGTVIGSTSVTMSGGTVTEYIYGGGYNGACGSTFVTISGGTVTDSVYGGGYQGHVAGTASISFSNAEVGLNIFGGGRSTVANVQSTDIQVFSGSCSAIYGGGDLGTVSQDTSVRVEGGEMIAVFGGGNQGAVSGNTSVTVTGGTVNYVFGGGFEGAVTEDATVTITGGRILKESTPIVEKSVYGGGDLGTVSGDRTININGGTIENGISSESADSSAINLGTPKTIIIGGSIQGGVSGVAPVNIENTPVYLTALPISGITAATPVAASSITVAPSYYGKNGLVTDADGVLYFYLPAGGTAAYTPPAPAPTPATKPQIEKIEQFIKDKETGISVYSKSLPDNAWMKVTPVSLTGGTSSDTSSNTSSEPQDGTIVAKFDMTVSSNFSGKATLSVPVGEEYNGKTLTVIFGSGDDAEEFECVVGGGRITFTTTKYLSFMILDQSAMAGGTVSSEPVAIPDTSDTARLFPFALLILSGITAGAMLGKKKQAK